MKVRLPEVPWFRRASRFAPVARAGVACALLVALVACGSPHLADAPGPEPLRVVATDPASGASDVPVGVHPSATFDGDVATGTLPDAFTLRRAGSEVPGATEYRAESRTARFVPDAALEPGTAYVVTVADTVTSAGGGALHEEVQWAFTTEEASVGPDGDEPGSDEPGGDGDTDSEPSTEPDSGAEVRVEGVAIIGGDRTLGVGEEVVLEAEVEVAGDATGGATGEVDRTVAWSTGDPGVAMIDEDGRLTAVAPGSTTATATSVPAPDVSGTIAIEVRDEAAASFVTLDPEAASFPGTSEATIELRADGSWTARSDAPWLSVDPPAGSGDATLALTVDRTGLTPGDHGARIVVEGGTVEGDTVEASVTVAMRFPTVHGQVAGDASGPAGPTFTSAGLSATDRSRSGGGDPGGRDADVGVAGVDHVPGEVLVRFDPVHVAAAARGAGRLDLAAVPLRRDEVLATAAAVARRNDLANVGSLADRNAIVLARTNRPLEETIAALQADPRVVSAEPNRYLRFAADPNDPEYADQWHYPMIGLPEAWDTTIGTADVTVAVIDGGFAIGHEDLAAKWTGGYDFASGVPGADATGTACARHGTHVAGTVGASTNDGVGVAGVAPNARLLPIQIGYQDPDDPDPTCRLQTSALVSALAWIAGDEVPGVPPLAEADVPHVVNLSLGATRRIVSIEPLLVRLRDEGIVTVAAAGNDEAEGLLYPARYDTTIAVGAVGRDGLRAWYSNFGDGLDVMAPGGSASFGAPESDVLSTLPPTALAPNGTYGFLAGTSMATPHVAGVVALLRSFDPSLDLEAARQVLHRSGDGFASGWSPEVGYGLIRADEAVRVAREERFGAFEAVLSQGGAVLATVPVSRDGVFAFQQVSAGGYVVEVVGPGEAGGGAVTVGYEGDAFVRVEVE